MKKYEDPELIRLFINERLKEIFKTFNEKIIEIELDPNKQEHVSAIFLIRSRLANVFWAEHYKFAVSESFKAMVENLPAEKTE